MVTEMYFYFLPKISLHVFAAEFYTLHSVVIVTKKILNDWSFPQN